VWLFAFAHLKGMPVALLGELVPLSGKSLQRGGHIDMVNPAGNKGSFLRCGARWWHDDNRRIAAACFARVARCPSVTCRACAASTADSTGRARVARIAGVTSGSCRARRTR